MRIDSYVKELEELHKRYTNGLLEINTYFRYPTGEATKEALGNIRPTSGFTGITGILEGTILILGTLSLNLINLPNQSKAKKEWQNLMAEELMQLKRKYGR